MVSLRFIIISLLPMMLIIDVNNTIARELRPSVHGLDYQTSSSSSPVGEKLPPEMKQFFRSAPNSKSSSMALPRAINSNDDTTWWNDVSGDKGRDRLKHVLLVGSLVCGAVGAALLAVAGFIYFGRFKRQNQIINSKAIVVTK